jgi:type III HopA1-like effector protein
VEAAGQVWAEKAGVSRMFAPGEFANFDAPGSPVAAGMSIGVYVARESSRVLPGFYVAFSETVSSSDHLDIVRFYWNIDGTGVRVLLRALTRDLNRFQVPFQFKCPIYWQSYSRRDTAVLYIKKNFYFLVRDLAIGWQEECNPYLRDDVPLFSLPLFPGVSLAEDPGSGESFGMNRCHHLAEAVWNSYTAGLPKEQYLQAVKQQFQKHGLDFTRPYLNAGSVDQYIN